MDVVDNFVIVWRDINRKASSVTDAERPVSVQWAQSLVEDMLVECGYEKTGEERVIDLISRAAIRCRFSLSPDLKAHIHLRNRTAHRERYVPTVEEATQAVRVFKEIFDSIQKFLDKDNHIFVWNEHRDRAHSSSRDTRMSAVVLSQEKVELLLRRLGYRCGVMGDQPCIKVCEKAAQRFAFDLPNALSRATSLRKRLYQPDAMVSEQDAFEAVENYYEFWDRLRSCAFSQEYLIVGRSIVNTLEVVSLAEVDRIPDNTAKNTGDMQEWLTIRNSFTFPQIMNAKKILSTREYEQYHAAKEGRIDLKRAIAILADVKSRLRSFESTRNLATRQVSIDPVPKAASSTQIDAMPIPREALSQSLPQKTHPHVTKSASTHSLSFTIYHLLRSVLGSVLVFYIAYELWTYPAAGMELIQNAFDSLPTPVTAGNFFLEWHKSLSPGWHLILAIPIFIVALAAAVVAAIIKAVLGILGLLTYVSVETGAASVMLGFLGLVLIISGYIEFFESDSNKEKKIEKDVAAEIPFRIRWSFFLILLLGQFWCIAKLSDLRAVQESRHTPRPGTSSADPCRGSARDHVLCEKYSTRDRCRHYSDGFLVFPGEAICRSLGVLKDENFRPPPPAPDYMTGDPCAGRLARERGCMTNQRMRCGLPQEASLYPGYALCLKYK